MEHDYAPGSEVVRVLEQSRKHSLALVTASKADNLFWLGRYTERVFTTLSQFFPFYDRVMDTDVDAFRPFARALDICRRISGDCTPIDQARRFPTRSSTASCTTRRIRIPYAAPSSTRSTTR